MVEYLGQTWTQQALMERVGNIRQIAGATAITYDEGQSRGVHAYQVQTGAGLDFDVLADRALDVGQVRYNGLSLVWSSPVGVMHPAYYEAQGMGWLRSFAGGLVTTCGLDQFGSPAEDDGESFGIHGRISHVPAQQIAHQEYWQDDDYIIELSGQMRQARLFGENLLLKRRIYTQLGAKTIDIEDTVINESFHTQPHMILYHCNLGFPLLSASTQLQANIIETKARDTRAQKGIADWMRFQEPTSDYAEQVFRHSIQPDKQGKATVNIHNPDLKLGLSISYSHNTLPHLFQWKMMGKGAYVVGIEPANCGVIEGRAIARVRGALPMLEPGEMRTYRLCFTVYDG